MYYDQPQVYSVISSTGGPSKSEPVGTRSSGKAYDPAANFARSQDTPPVAGYWQLRTMITKYCQTLDTLWLKLPLYTLDIKYLPRES